MNNSQKDSLFIEFTVGGNNSCLTKNVRHSLFHDSVEMNPTESIPVCDAKRIIRIYYKFFNNS